MRSPGEIMDNPAQSTEQQPIPMPGKSRKVPKRLVFAVVFLLAVVAAVGTCSYSSMGKPAEVKQGSVNHETISRSSMRESERDRSDVPPPVRPELLNIIGSVAEFEIEGIRYRVFGSGPIGDDYFVAELREGYAVIFAPDGRKLRVGVRRQSPASLWLNDGNQAGKVPTGRSADRPLSGL